MEVFGYVGTIRLLSILCQCQPIRLKSCIVLTTLTNGRKFTKLDLSAAYQQMLLDEESTKLVTVNTHLGLFRYYRLPFGPAIFQHAMDTLLQRVTNVIC